MGVAWATPVTQHFISTHDKPLYADLPYMPYANPNAPKGGEFSLSAQGTFDNFQAMNGKGSAASGLEYLYDSLMKRSPDETTASYPLLAQSVTIDPADASYAIFHLNPKARFSDGSPVRADDVVFSFQAALKQGAPGIRSYFADIKSVKALSPLDVRFDYKTKDNAEITAIVAELSIYSKKDFGNKPYDRIMATPPLGSGPYVIDRIDAGRSITYKRNPNYWGADLPINRGRYNFDQIKYTYYRSQEIAFEGFKAGQFYYYPESKARNWALAYDFPAAQQGLVSKQNLKTYEPIQTQMLVLNMRHSVLSDPTVRKALTYAYDFEWMNKALFFKQYQRLQSFFEGSELAATGKPSAAEMKILQPLLAKMPAWQQAGVLADWHYPVSDASGYNRQNLLIAHQLLLQAGYKYRQGTLLDKQGHPVRFEMPVHQENIIRTLLPFVRNLKRLGIEVVVQQVDTPQYIERMRHFDFDIIGFSLPQSSSPGNEQTGFWGSEAANQPNSYNVSGIKNPQIDQVIQHLIAAPDRQTQVLYTHVLDRLLRAGYYVIPTYGRAGTWVATWNMYEQPAKLPKYDIGIDYWWVNPQKAAVVQNYFEQKQQSQKQQQKH